MSEENLLQQLSPNLPSEVESRLHVVGMSRFNADYMIEILSDLIKEDVLIKMKKKSTKKLSTIKIYTVTLSILIIAVFLGFPFMLYSIYQSFASCDGVFGDYYALNFKWHRNYERFNIKYEGTYDLNKVNDESLDFEKYPWIVRIIGEWNRTEAFFFGTGFLVSDRDILTAAHCIEFDDVKYNVKLKELQIGGTAENEFNDSLIIPIDEVTMLAHPKYNPSSDLNDIGMFKLKIPIKISKTIHPLRLPFDHVEVPKNLTLTGWIDEDTLNNPQLREELIPVIPEKRCENYCKRTFENKTYTTGFASFSSPRRFCAGKITTCIRRGDSGSPLTLMDKSGPIAFGIASLGRADESTNVKYLIPGLFTNIYPYLHWILCNGGDELKMKKCDKNCP